MFVSFFSHFYEKQKHAAVWRFKSCEIAANRPPEAKVKTTTHGIENIQYRGCHLWSSLPREIKDSNTLAEFKRKIKSWDGNTCICRLCKVFIKDLGFL